MMNRFPKMMILWEEKMIAEGYDPLIAQALGHACATAFAMAKNRSTGQRKKSSKKIYKSDPVNMNEGWSYAPIPEIPQKGVYYKITREGVLYKLGNRIENGTRKYLSQIQIKFTDDDQYRRYKNFAKAVVKMLGDRWRSRWYKAWKKIRDLDWDITDPYQALEYEGNQYLLKTA